VPPPSVSYLADRASHPVLRASARRQGTTQVVTVSGEMDISTVPQVGTLLDRAIGERPETLVLDLSAVDFCDSSGIHQVVKTHHRAAAARIRFRVIPPTGPARRAFEICSIGEFVSLVSGEDASAVAS
jgi:anti-sigma B factor antagonist